MMLNYIHSLDLILLYIASAIVFRVLKHSPQPFGVKNDNTTSSNSLSSRSLRKPILDTIILAVCFAISVTTSFAGVTFLVGSIGILLNNKYYWRDGVSLVKKDTVYLLFILITANVFFQQCNNYLNLHKYFGAF